MTRKDFDAFLAERVAQITSSLASKGGEYSPGEDRLQNFRDLASWQETTPAQACWNLLTKHLVSVKAMRLAPGRYTAAQWREKVMDSVNYLLLLEAIAVEEIDAQD